MLLSLLLFLTLGCSEKKTPPYLKAPGFSIFWSDNAKSEKWGNYLYRHLSKRSKEKNIVLLQKKKAGFINIHIEVNSKLEYDYYIGCEQEHFDLKAKNGEAMLWLIYQLLDVIPRYNEYFTAEDLPPAILDFHDRQANFDFEYREPHFRGNTENEEYTAIIGAHNVDNSWGIWGHNLKKVFARNASGAIYARKNGRIMGEQYCFSSDETYNHIEAYISDNYGDSEKYRQRFMIMPNDNLIVCDCNKCKQNGNSPTNATPAVSLLIGRLASRFPHHMFFTTAYLTTAQPPKVKLPSNMGVMISTIDIPKGVHLNQQKEVKAFLSTLNAWKEYTNNIYIWDYAANFDDYLTPIPVLHGLKKQLQFYKANGVTGVFLNANGYDYAPFDDVKTYVAANLMIDADLSVDSLCTKFFDKYYPSSGKALCNYYLSLEEKMETLNKPYNIYGGFEEAIASYLDIPGFISFYDTFAPLISNAKGEEKQKLQKLYTALTFTRLQIAYHQRSGGDGFTAMQDGYLAINPEIKTYINRLAEYKRFEDLTSYKEVGGEIDSYIKSWERVLKIVPKGNKLQGEQLEALSKLDREYSRIDMLNDGVVGFEGDYHQGWLLNSAGELHIGFSTRNIKNAKKMTIRFLLDRKHHILPPGKVVIYKDGMIYKEITEMKNIDSDSPGIKGFVTGVDLRDATTIAVKMIRNKDARSIACDEIFFN
ncbi:DUF4838 domain-containing protein [Dysgonomonas sp. 511]|uniref:DUF4838 domain-containing protein n=1 Tax=Dysgonomonas sp. 511 TaxID=2302930 RepID=UPI001C8808B6|nr:DUF4838 domain-containing protein [Dysgonomonas sp. 511]